MDHVGLLTHAVVEDLFSELLLVVEHKLEKVKGALALLDIHAFKDDLGCLGGD